jgi:hypothetical protein
LKTAEEMAGVVPELPGIDDWLTKAGAGDDKGYNRLSRDEVCRLIEGRAETRRREALATAAADLEAMIEAAASAPGRKYEPPASIVKTGPADPADFQYEPDPAERIRQLLPGAEVSLAPARAAYVVRRGGFEFAVAAEEMTRNDDDALADLLASRLGALPEGARPADAADPPGGSATQGPPKCVGCGRPFLSVDPTATKCLDCLLG